MFSQFRQAVESLAQSQDGALSADGRSRSPDPLRQSSAQLAETTLVNLRKSIAAQRVTTPAQQDALGRSRSASPGPPSSTKTTSNGLRKTTLEERLRASLAGPESHNPSTAPPPTPRTPPLTQDPATAPVLDSPSLVLGTIASTPDSPAGDSAQAEERGRIDALVAPQVPSDATQPGIPPTDPCLHPAGSTSHSMDAVHTDSTPEPCIGMTLTQEAPQVADTEFQQPLVQQCAQDSGVVDQPATGAGLSEGDAKSMPEPTATDKSEDASVEVLQERLKLMEQRFADVSTSFKKLQVERQDIDGTISELTPLEGSRDVAALREYLANVNIKLEFSQDELQRLNGKLTRQEEQLVELQHTHQLEATLQSGQTEKLRQQLNEAEALVAASQSAVSQTKEDSDKRDSDIEHLRAQVTKASEVAKEEEEKRVKAISLLKTVRQKLVKAEKERDEALRELNEVKDRISEEKEKERAERANLEKELDTVNAEHENTVVGLRAQFDKDIAVAKDRAERDVQTVQKQSSAEINAIKTSYSAEISTKKSRISTLENTVAHLTGENKSFFEQLELRQAELESSQCHAELLQAQNTELLFQLKESQERITLLTDEVGELRGEHEIRSQVSGISAEEISHMVSLTEIKYEARLAELKRTLSTAEKERTEAEETWSRKFTEKTRESEELKCMLQSSVRLREQDGDVTSTLKAEIEKLEAQTRSQQSRLHELQTYVDVFKDAESTLHRRLSEVAARADDNSRQLEESRSRETQLRTQNKTLRDELRKVQSSVTVLERQRKPGVAYWAPRPEASDSRTSITSTPDVTSSSSLTLVRNEEEISHEYLRNVILQFLEHKEMRPNLVRVLSTILHFTPQETRRLMSKV